MRSLFSFVAVIGLLNGFVCGVALTQDVYGRFKGNVVASFQGDGRNMRLEKPFGYVDPKGRAWDVPAGAVTDGASIPQIFWITHPPFTGKYRSAAVVHDHFCQTKSHRWQDTHEMFYHAMRAAGVDDGTAKTMFGAVYYFGPRWGIGTAERGPGGEKGLTPKQQEAFVKQLEVWISTDKPTVEEIAKRLA